MGVSSRTLTLMIIVVNMESSMNSPPLIPPQQNGVVERKNKTLISPARSMLDEYGRPKGFGRRQLTPLAMLQIGSIFTGCLRRPPMSCWLEGSQMCHTSGFLDASVTSTRRDNILASSKEGVALVSWLGTPQAPRHIGSTMNPPELWKKLMMW